MRMSNQLTSDSPYLSNVRRTLGGVVVLASLQLLLGRSQVHHLLHNLNFHCWLVERTSKSEKYDAVRSMVVMMYVKTKETILPALISLRIYDIYMCVPSDSPNCHQSVAKSRDDEEAAKGFDMLHMHMRQEESELAKEWQHYPTHEIR